MSKFESAFKAAIADNERRILISTLRSSPELTLGELHKLSKGDLGRLFSEITLGQLIHGEGAALAGDTEWGYRCASAASTRRCSASTIRTTVSSMSG